MKDNPLNKLITSARKAPKKSIAPNEMPFGFSTRVAARWAETPRSAGVLDLMERFGWWGAGVSTAICLMAMVHRSTLPEPNPLDLILSAQSDAEAELF